MPDYSGYGQPAAVEDGDIFLARRGAGDVNPIAEQLRAYALLGYPAVDSNGNLLAQVVPRVDTLANLLAIADAGDGEVATASDKRAQVIYRGSPSVGLPAYQYRVAAEAAGILAFTSIPAGSTWTPVPLTKKYDPDALFNLSQIVKPAGLPYLAASTTLVVRSFVQAQTLAAASPPGTEWLCKIQRKLISTGAWQSLGEAVFSGVTPALADPDTTVSFTTISGAADAYLSLADWANTDRFRLVAVHSAGAPVFLTNGSCVLQFMEA